MTRRGFSLVEALVAMVILGVLLAAVLGPIGGLFKISRSNQQTLNNTTLAQQVAERIVNAWTDPARFSGGCLDLAAEPLPAGVSVTVQDLDALAAPTSAPRTLAACPGAAASSAPLRRVHIVADGGGPKAEVVLDVARPPAGGGGP